MKTLSHAIKALGIFCAMPLFLFCSLDKTQPRKAQVVFITGTSSSGKTTLLNNLKEKHLDADYLERDAIYVDRAVALLQKNDAKNFADVYQVFGMSFFYAIYYAPESPLLRDRMTSDIREQLSRLSPTLEAIRPELDKTTDEILEKEVRKAATRSKHVIVDAVFLSEADRGNYTDLEAKYIQLYSSPYDLVKNVETRANEAIEKNNLIHWRPVVPVLMHYATLYRAVDENSTNCVDTLVRSELETTLAAAHAGDKAHLPKGFELESVFIKKFFEGLEVGERERFCVEARHKSELLLVQSEDRADQVVERLSSASKDDK